MKFRFCGNRIFHWLLRHFFPSFENQFWLFVIVKHKLKSVFYESVLLLMINFVITLFPLSLPPWSSNSKSWSKPTIIVHFEVRQLKLWTSRKICAPGYFSVSFGIEHLANSTWSILTSKNKVWRESRPVLSTIHNECTPLLLDFILKWGRSSFIIFQGEQEAVGASAGTVRVWNGSNKQTSLPVACSWLSDSRDGTIIRKGKRK